jgi:hypothetical protein
VGLHRGIDGAEPVNPGDDRQGAALHKVGRAAPLAHGTLACPACDAPVSPGPVPISPATALRCPYCERTGPARDFLSLSAPTRPAHVEIRVVHSRRLVRRR